LFFQAISVLDSIRRMPKIPRDVRKKARQHICELYMAGFTPQEIEYLTEARWKSNTIAKYCRGLEVNDTLEKNRMLGLLKEFVQIDGSWEELDYYVKTKRNLKSENLVLDDIIEQKKEIDNHGVDLETIGSINTMLTNYNTNWERFLDYYKLVISVLELGYSFPDLETIKQKTLELGGIDPAITTIGFALTKADVEKEIIKVNKQIYDTIERSKAEERKLEEIKHSAKIIQTYVDYAEELLNKYRLDPIALQTIITTAQKYGKPAIILQALNTYESLRELEQSVLARLEEIKAYDHELINIRAKKENLESQIANLYRRLGIIEEKHRQSRLLQNIASLLNDPSNAEINAGEFMLLSLSLLIGIRDYSFIHSATLPKWNIFVKNNIDNAVNRLDNIITGKL
jgi:hypothetical protein